MMNNQQLTDAHNELVARIAELEKRVQELSENIAALDVSETKAKLPQK